jgi:hypothetical protein
MTGHHASAHRGAPGGWASLVAAVVALACALAAPASAITCDPSHFPAADQTFYLNLTVNNQLVTTYRFNQQATFWAAIGVMAFDTQSDYDATVYPTCAGGQALGASAYAAGRTDFVIGDFNNNPTGSYAADLFCYGGACTAPGTYGAGTWRTGDFLFVDFPPTTVNFLSGPPYSPDMVFHVWDVFLSAGSTYYFQFSSTLGSASKMLLFRNPSGGTYWSGRAGAVFEVSGCTSYTAPSTGYYGLVVVNDVFALGSYTVGVSSTPQCACADELPARVPVAVPAAPTTAYKWVNQTWNSWAAIGTRPAAGSDWDLEVSTSAASPGCSQAVLASSVAGVGVADFVITDFNFSAVPTTLAARTYRYSGSGGTTVEWDRNVMPGELLQVNGPRAMRSWGPSDVLECWDVFLTSGDEYTFEFFPSSNVQLFLFRNPGSSLYSTGRTGAVAQGAGTFTYTAPSTGYYGVVAVKDDEQPGTFALRVGRCEAPTPMVAGLTLTGAFLNFHYLSIAPAAGRWTAVGSRSLTADWDLVQYGSTTAAPWQDCFTPTGAVSDASSVPDFIVGDLRQGTQGVYPIRAKQFTSGDPEPVDLEWTGSATPLGINDPAIMDSPSSSEVLRVYEAFLVAGWSYQITYTQSASRPLLVYANPSAGEYWAPRNTALLSTTGSTSFTAPATGHYAFVIANDAAESGSFSLAINTSTSVDVGAGDLPAVTRFEGARPNPARSDLALHYALASPGHVRLEMLDLTGRRVWSEDQGVRGAGQWSASLPRGAGTGRVPAGLYFVRFEVNGRVAAVNKVTLLE